MNCQTYVDTKKYLITKFLKENNRDTVIVGISGGVDSAVVLALLLQIENIKVIPVIAPIYDSTGTTEQEEAYKLAMNLCAYFEIEPTVFHLGPLSNMCVQTLNLKNDYEVQQNDYWLRPMAFYSVAMKHENSIMVSTVNGTEWCLGWFSQYLDIFGIHPIVDLYKHEVYEVAKYLNVPDFITNVKPKGGLACGSTDEEALGFTYAESRNHNNEAVKKRIQDTEFKRQRFNNDFIFSVCEKF